MTKTVLTYALAFLILVPAQAIIFNRMILFDVAVPLVFIGVIIKLPITAGTNLATFLGFLAGLGVDIFCDTPGVNALACTLMAFVRKPVYHLYVSPDDDPGSRAPSSHTIGYAPFMKYLLTMTAFFCTIVFVVEALQFFNFRLLLLRIFASTIYTFVLLFAFDSATYYSPTQTLRKN